MCVLGEQSEEGIGCPGTGVTDGYGCEPPYECWKRNLGLLQEQPVPLNMEPSLQLSLHIFRCDSCLPDSHVAFVHYTGLFVIALSYFLFFVMILTNLIRALPLKIILLLFL